MKLGPYAASLLLACVLPLNAYAQSTAPTTIPAVPAPAAATAPATTPAAPASLSDISAESVRFFGDTCLKYVGAPDKMIAFLDGAFGRRDAQQGAAFRGAAHAGDDAIVWGAALPGDNFAVVWDPTHVACNIIGQKAVDPAAVRVELNKLMADVNATPPLHARVAGTPAAPGSYTEDIEITGLPDHAVGIVASVNLAQKPNEAGSFYTLFVRRTTPPPAAAATSAPAAPVKR